jgi:peptide/nickel transport system ATP-binding protein
LSAVESTSSRRSILQLPATLKRRLGMGYLFVTNDLNVVRLLCDRSVIAVSLRGAAGDEAISTDRVLSGPSNCV